MNSAWSVIQLVRILYILILQLFQATMSLVNCSVFNRSTNRLLLPWSILSVGISGITVQQFYDDKVICELEKHDVVVKQVQLDSAFLGRSKESLDRIELLLPLDSAIQLFGPFLRYHTYNLHQQSPPRQNALALMMFSQQQLSQPGLPAFVPVHTKKDKLYNDFLQMLKDKQLLFLASEVQSSGKNFVKTIVDCLWYLDGHHETSKKQSCPIPELFLRFSGYNTPELSKHRKRQCTNMSSAILKTLASSLFQNLQASFWKNPSWEMVHQQVISIKYVHSCSGVVLRVFEDLSLTLQEKNCYEYVHLNAFTPDLARKWYEYIQSLERNGLPTPVMLLTYSSGNNVDNLHFVWKVQPDESIEESFQRSQEVIEQVKPNLSQFHTRAMRQAMFEKFGRVSPSVKPAVLQFFYRELTGDCSASHDAQEAVIDERVREIISMEPENPNTLIDLPGLNSKCFGMKPRSLLMKIWELL